jgi:lipid-A-disaccharide synthase
MPSIYLSAGEPSGDKHASMLARALFLQAPGSTIFGMGGDGMSAAGVEITQPIDRMAVMGFAEVMARYPTIRRAFGDAVENCRSRRPDLAVLVDYPAFHLKLAKELKALGVPVVLYIAPQVWAWKAGRARTVARVARKLLVIFEFEVAPFEEAGVDVEFVGHPLMDEIDASDPGGKAREKLGLDAETPLLAILPGSRRQVRKRLLPIYLEAVKQVRHVRPEVTAAVGTPDGSPKMFEGDESALPPTVKTHDLLRDAAAGMYNSGTMSLEAAILGCPGVVGYKMNWFNYQVAKQVVKLPHIALPNIVLGKVAMHELVQDDLTPATAAAEMLSLLTYPERRAESRALLREVRERLGPPGASERAAEVVLRLL